MPEILIVQLKRFQFNLSTHEREKVDNYFEFPYRLDICKATVTPDVSQWYDLIGILMHSGTAQGGHYFSHILNENGKWNTFNDTVVRPSNPDSLIEECCGGDRSANLQDAIETITAEPKSAVKFVAENFGEVNRGNDKMKLGYRPMNRIGKGGLNVTGK